MIDPPDTCLGVCHTPLPIRIKNLIPIYRMNLKPGTCLDVCNTPIPIRDKYLINTYLLNPILGKDWIVCVGAYCIRPTNAHNHGQMIDPSSTFLGLCYTLLPIRDKYLINKCLLNLISGKDWMVRVGAYCIRYTNANDHWQMIDPPDTFRVVCNMPLSIPDKFLINTHLLNHILGKDWIIRVGAYCIRPTNVHDHGQMIDPPGTCRGVCNTPLPIRNKYLINTYLLNPILGKYWIVRVGSYCIRPTNALDYGQMIDPTNTFLGVCNTPLPIRDKYLINTYLLNLIPGKNWIVGVGAYCIRPTNAHDHGQMIDPSSTCWGVCNTPLSIRNKYLINTYLLNLIPGKD